MKVSSTVLVAVICLLGVGSSVLAQTESAEVKVSRAAAERASSRHAGKIIALDTSEAPTSAIAPMARSDRREQRAAVAHALRPKRLGSGGELLTCPRDRGNCDFRGADVILTIAEPVIRGDSAFVAIRTQKPSARGLVYQLRETEVYTMKNGVWTFARNYVRSTT